MHASTHVLFLLFLASPSWCMENQEIFDPEYQKIARHLLFPHRKTLPPVIPKDIKTYLTLFLSINCNPETSPLKSLFNQYAELPEIKKEPVYTPILDLKLCASDNTLVEVSTARLIEQTLNFNAYTSLPHEREFNIAQISSDGSFVALANCFGSVPLSTINWSEDFKKITKKSVSSNNKHNHCPTAIAISPDNTIIATAVEMGMDINIYFYHKKRLREMSTYITFPLQKIHPEQEYCYPQKLFFSCDNKKLIMLSNRNTLSVFDYEQKKLIFSRSLAFNNYITDALILEDCETIILGTTGGSVIAYNIKTNTSSPIHNFIDTCSLRLHSIKHSNNNFDTYYIFAIPEAHYRNYYDWAGKLIIFTYNPKNNVASKPFLKNLVPKPEIKIFDRMQQGQHTALTITADHRKMFVCSPDHSIKLLDTTGFFYEILLRLTKLSFAQQILLQAYDKLLAQGKTPVTINSDTLEEKVIRFMDPLILEILIQEKIVELPVTP